MNTNTMSHHAVAERLQSRQRVIEQIGRLTDNLARGSFPPLSEEDQQRVARIQVELSELHKNASNAFQANANALRESRGEAVPSALAS